MTTRRASVLLIAAGVLGARTAQAQAPRAGPNPRVIGFLGLYSASVYARFVSAFREGLSALGRQEGRDIAIEYRWADGHEDRLPELARQLVALRPDVIVTHTATGIRAAQAATSTIPIVMGVSSDPVGLGHVSSLARPGGNTTGVSSRMPTIGGLRQFADAGGLLAYGGDFVEGWRLAASYVHKILNGANPAELPVEQPKKFELTINLKTAQSIGLVIPQSLVVAASNLIR